MRLKKGAASKSYGIEVARLAGLPPQVIHRARQVLKQHERSERQNVAVETEAPMQMTMFTPLSQRILDRLEETDVNSLTPLQALTLLDELKEEIKAGSAADEASRAGGPAHDRRSGRRGVVRDGAGVAQAHPARRRHPVPAQHRTGAAGDGAAARGDADRGRAAIPLR